MDVKKLLFTVEEVAELFCVTPQAARAWVRNKEIKAVKTGKRYLVHRDDLNAYWVSQGGKPLFTEEVGQ